ncbi:MAG: hypothetical protein ACRDP7_39745 [Trebonia sp.]
MKLNTTDVAAARLGAACLGVRHARAPWANLLAVWANHARTQNAVLAASGTRTRRVASWPLPAQTQQFALMSAGLLPTANDTRKHNVQKTRISVGGYGAMGPQPEREQPA